MPMDLEVIYFTSILCFFPQICDVTKVVIILKNPLYRSFN